MERSALESRSQLTPQWRRLLHFARQEFQLPVRNQAATRRPFEPPLRVPSFSNRRDETCFPRSGTTAAPSPCLSLFQNAGQVRTPPWRRWFFRIAKGAVQQDLCCHERVESGP